jgi:hypothetical protein
MVYGEIREVIVKYTFIGKQKVVLYHKLEENQMKSATIALRIVFLMCEIAAQSDD